MLGRLARQLAGQAARQLVANAKSQHAASQTPAPDEPEWGMLFSMRLEAAPVWDRMEAAMPCKVGRMAATAGRLGKRFCVASVGGVGESAAKRAAKQLLELRPQRVLIAGLVCGLTDEVSRGDLLIGESVSLPDGSVAPLCLDGIVCDGELRDGNDHMVMRHVSRVATAPHVICDPTTRRELATTQRAMACDLETGWIAQICHEQGVAVSAIRIVCDEVNDELPADIAALRQQKTSAGRLGAAAGAVFRAPGRAMDLWNLRQVASECSQRLAELLPSMLK